MRVIRPSDGLQHDSTHFRKARRCTSLLRRLSQTPNLPLFAIVSAIFFRPNPSRVFRVGHPVLTSHPSV